MTDDELEQLAQRVAANVDQTLRHCRESQYLPAQVKHDMLERVGQAVYDVLVALEHPEAVGNQELLTRLDAVVEQAPFSIERYLESHPALSEDTVCRS